MEQNPLENLDDSELQNLANTVVRLAKKQSEIDNWDKNEFEPLIEAAKQAGFNVPVPHDIRVQIMNKGYGKHELSRLKEKCCAVYIFNHNDKCLKVGKAWKNSNNRFQYQHYRPSGSKSNLANSLIRSRYQKGLSESNVKNWIIENTSRINVIIPESYGKKFLNFAEAFYILKFNPLFEGR